MENKDIDSFVKITKEFLMMLFRNLDKTSPNH